jgi:thiol-disulfide isomerase/thioredoxin
VDLRSAAPGRPTLVNLWATWCAPCVDEVPELVDLSLGQVTGWRWSGC